MRAGTPLLLVTMTLWTVACSAAAAEEPSEAEAHAFARSHPGMAPASAPPARDDPSPLVGEVRFPHQEHVNDLELPCDECHHETNAAPLAIPHDDIFRDFWVDCQICHHPEGSPELEPQSCSNCHRRTAGDVADETLSAKVVIHRRCWSCHESGTGVEASKSCGDCHAKSRPPP